MDTSGMLAWVGLIRSARIVMHRFDLYLKEEFGLSFGEVSLMAQLHIANGELAMVALANNLVITKAGLTKMVDRLASNGLVRRANSKDDRRVVHVVLTSEGLKRLEIIRPAYRQWVEEHVLSHISDDDLEAVGRSLLTIANANGADVPELRTGTRSKRVSIGRDTP